MVEFILFNLFFKIGKEDGKDQETIQSGTTPDPRYHMGM